MKTDYSRLRSTFSSFNRFGNEMIPVDEQRRIYDQSVVHLDDTFKAMDEAQKSLDKATDAYHKARGFAEEAWKELIEVVKREILKRDD